MKDGFAKKCILICAVVAAVSAFVIAFKDRISYLPGAFEDKFSSVQPLRDPLITLNSMVDYYVFDSSSNDDVIIGKDGWLFYSGKNDGDPLSQYLGSNIPDAETLETYCKNVLKLQEKLENMGCELIIFVAPNKERVYNEYMPDRLGPPAETYQLSVILEYLRKNTDVKIVYPLDEIRAAKKTSPYDLYYKDDTHWNSLGAYIGVKELASSMGISLPALDSGKYTIREAGADVYDLSEMLKLHDVIDPGSSYQIEGYDHVDSTGPSYHEFRFVSSKGDPRKLMVCKDSFCTAMAPYLSSMFSESLMIHKDGFGFDRVGSFSPDIFVLEMAERYVPSGLTMIGEW